MPELKKTHISEIATLYAVQDKPDAYYYEAKEVEKKMLELELKLIVKKIKICKMEQKFLLTNEGVEKSIELQKKYEAEANEICKKLEEK